MNLAISDIRRDPRCQPRTVMDATAIAEYAEGYASGVTLPPVDVFFDGTTYWLSDGFHRVAAAENTGLEEIPVDIHRGTLRDAILYSCGVNATHGLRRTNPDKRRAVLTLLRDPEWSKWSNREIARRCAVGRTLVNDIRNELSDRNGQIDEPQRLVRRGGSTYTMDTDGIGTQAEVPAASQSVGATAYNNHLGDDDGDEWYTPKEHVELARQVMGGIDLDPATHLEAQAILQIPSYFTKEDDALNKPWFGRVWLNPPYSMPLIQRFVDKLITEYDEERVSQAIILTNNCTDTVWFHKLLSRFPVCFARGRVKFWRPGNKKFATRQGQAFFYAGAGERRSFIRVFSRIGAVLEFLT